MENTLTARAQKRIESDNRILHAAAKVFGSLGYSRATLTDIANEAGVSQGLVSQRFGSKENLLCETFKQTRILSFYDDENCHMPQVFYVLLDHLKKDVTEEPDWFRFLGMVYTGTDDIPDSFADLTKEMFLKTPLHSAIVEAQELEYLPAGDPWDLFRVFFRNAVNLIGWHNEFGLPMPENDYFLYAIQYSKRQKQVRTMLRNQRYEIQKLEAGRDVLFTAISEIYPLIICCNLTQNSYHMLEYDRFTTTRADSEGKYDNLIQEGLISIPNEIHRRQFARMFGRENAIRSCESGKQSLTLRHLQTGDDGVTRWIETRMIFQECECGEHLAITLSRPVDDEMKRLQSYGEALQNAELALGAKSRFLSNLSHEIRTPMNVITGYTELMKRHTKEPDKILDYVSKMGSAEKDLMDMLTQALDAADISLSGASDVIKINISECCGGVQTFAFDLADQKGVDLSYNVGTLRDDYIYADEIRLQKSVMNLIIRAINESASGDSVRIYLEQLEDPDPDTVCLRLTIHNGINTECGIALHEGDGLVQNPSAAPACSGSEDAELGVAASDIEQLQKDIENLGGTLDIRHEEHGKTAVCTFNFKRKK